MSTATESGKLFISYSRADAAVVEAICDALEARGVSIWIDQGDIPAGDDILQRINRGLEQSKVFVAMVGDTYFSDGRFTTSEFGAAFFKAAATPDWRVLVVRLGDAVELPPMVASRRYVVHRDPASTAEKLVEIIAGFDAQDGLDGDDEAPAQRAAAAPVEFDALTDRDLDITVAALLGRRIELLRESGPMPGFEIDLPRGRRLEMRVLRVILENEAIFLLIDTLKERVSIAQRYIAKYTRDIDEGLLGKFEVATEIALERQEAKLVGARQELRTELSAIAESACIRHPVPA